MRCSSLMATPSPVSTSRPTGIPPLFCWAVLLTEIYQSKRPRKIFADKFGSAHPGGSLAESVEQMGRSLHVSRSVFLTAARSLCSNQQTVGLFISSFLSRSQSPSSILSPPTYHGALSSTNVPCRGGAAKNALCDRKFG